MWFACAYCSNCATKFLKEDNRWFCDEHFVKRQRELFLYHNLRRTLTMSKGSTTPSTNGPKVLPKQEEEPKSGPEVEPPPTHPGPTPLPTETFWWNK